MATTIQLKRGTVAQWASKNTRLALAEVGLIIDAQRRTIALKVGDGTTRWNDLPEFAIGGGGASLTPFLSKTTTQMNAIAAPTPGMAVFNTTEDQIMVYTLLNGWVGVAMTL